MNVKRSKGKNVYQGALQAIRKNICKPKGIDYKVAKAAFYAFLEKHKDVEEYICSDFGIKAMYYDSLIMGDCYYNLFIKQGIPILSAHDELCFPPDKVDIVLPQMISSYRKVMKDALVQKGMLSKDEPLPDWMVPVITSD